MCVDFDMIDVFYSFAFSELIELAKGLEEIDVKAQYRSVTGVLLSHPDSRDVQLGNVTLTFHGAELLTDTKIELNVGRRYGLIGLNGCGRFQLNSNICCSILIQTQWL